jgi:hypothetical protein
MKRILKWVAIVVGSLLLIAFIAFLYLIPPFTLAPPEAFIKPESEAPPSLDHITDPAQRAIAERGKYIVMYTGCVGCHTPGGDKGPKWDEYLAGGLKFTDKHYGTVVTRNLTADPSTGLARRTDEQVKRTLRSGVFAEDGRIFNPFFMPWGDFSNWTEEDRYAVVTYLRNIKPMKHKIPDFSPASDAPSMSFYGLDYAIHEGEK